LNVLGYGLISVARTVRTTHKIDSTKTVQIKAFLIITKKRERGAASVASLLLQSFLEIA
jgi:hypothetical protein